MKALPYIVTILSIILLCLAWYFETAPTYAIKVGLFIVLLWFGVVQLIMRNK